MRKIISALAITVTVFMLGTTIAFAHGHGGGRTTTAKYVICTVESCTLTGVHTHNQISYIGHYYGDGHDYHDICDLQSCISTGYHEHDGVYCFEHTASDGHSYHNNSCSGAGNHHL